MPPLVKTNCTYQLEAHSPRRPAQGGAAPGRTASSGTPAGWPGCRRARNTSGYHVRPAERPRRPAAPARAPVSADTAPLSAGRAGFWRQIWRRCREGWAPTDAPAPAAHGGSGPCDGGGRGICASSDACFHVCGGLRIFT